MADMKKSLRDALGMGESPAPRPPEPAPEVSGAPPEPEREHTHAETPPADPAPTATGGDSPPSDHELVTCVLGGVEFGLDINAVKEIVRLPKITPVPRAPDYVEGVANLRGNVLPIVNSRTRFGLDSTGDSDSNRVVVVELNGHPTGLIVDAVREVMHVSRADVEVAPAVVQSIDGRFLKGVVKLNGGKRLVLLLDHDAILDVTAQAATAASAADHGRGVERAQTEAASEAHEHLVTFRLAEEEYGIPIMDIQEIIRVPRITGVPNAPGGVIGVTSLRNRIIPVLDLRTKFGLPPCPNDARRDEERCLVVNVGGAAMALRVDAVNQVLQVPQTTVERTPAIVGGGAEDNQIRGIAKLDGGKRLVMLLAVEALVTRAELKDMGQMTGGKAGAEGTRSAADAEQDERQLVTFKVADEEFAVDIMQVQEIIRLEKVTKVPHAPGFVEGVVNLRGSVLPVIDLRKRVHIGTKVYSDATRVVVVDLKGVKTGIIVDSVSEVMRVHTRHIEPAPAIVRSRYGDEIIEGVGKLNNGERMFLLLRAAELLGVAPREPAVSA